MLSKWLSWLIPPPRLQIPAAIIGGAILGLGIFLIKISNAGSYVSDKPETCINCHVMFPQYATWYHGSHREVATCNDCHVPHQNLLVKYLFKAKDGLRHATIFTLRKEPQVIIIKEEGREVVHNNCIRCHASLMDDNKMTFYDPHFNAQRQDRVCWDCHRETPHGQVRSLSATPAALVPRPESVVPQWVKSMMNSK
ncbi:MAG: cytochrome c nitrite reductase small subunit [Bacteroidales bacterium]